MDSLNRRWLLPLILLTILIGGGLGGHLWYTSKNVLCPECVEQENWREPDWLRQLTDEKAGALLSSVGLYNTPVIYSENDSICIASPGNAGFKLQFEIDRGKVYEITIDGRNDKGRATLRLNHDGVKKWSKAPEGVGNYWIHGADSVELLIYADEAYSYRLDGVSIRECSECENDDDLRAEIFDQIPGLEKMLTEQPLAAVRQLLDWAANRADHASGKSIHDQTKISGLSASQIYYGVFKPNRGGVYCGGMSEFFNRILKLFGVDSFTWNFGDLRQDLTHVTVVVADHSGDDTRYFIFDPTFNLTLHDAASGELLDIEQLLVLIRKGQWGQVRPEVLPLEQRDFLVPKDRSRLCREFREEMEEWLVCGHPGYNVDVYLEQWNPRFQRAGYRTGLPGMLQLMANRSFSVGQGARPGTRDNFISLLERHGVPVGMP